MMGSGLFAGQRIELIDGDLIEKMGQKPPHAQAIRLLNKFLLGVFGAERVQVQLPVDVAPEDQERNEPEPDLAVLAGTKADYDTRHHRANELLLAVEVADSTTQFELSVKAALYARATLPEYWVLDVRRRVLVVHRQPEHGQYRQVIRLTESELAFLEGRADAAIAVSNLLPAVNPGR